MTYNEKQNLHNRVRKKLIKPEKCEHCQEVKKLDLANKSHKYKNSLKDWLWLCHSCHMKYDYTKEWRINNSLANKGKHSSNIGYKMSEETKQKLREKRKFQKPPMLGHKRTEKEKKNISIGVKKYYDNK